MQRISGRLGGRRFSIVRSQAAATRDGLPDDRPGPARVPPPRRRVAAGRVANALAAETSPYLRQHGDNPVDWLPWGEAALRRAREEDKPLLVSIGYSACHWCHVMERESLRGPRDRPADERAASSA